MDWLILLLLVPAILVPLVLLCGFAGCAQQVTFACESSTDCPLPFVCVDGVCVDPGVPGDPGSSFLAPPSPPEGLTASAVSDSAIALSWNDDPDATDFQIERAEEGDEGPVPIPRPPDQTRTSATDTGLAEGTFFRYQIRAINAQGPSEPSNEASATTLWSSFQPVLSDPFVTLGGSEPRRGDCIVQRIGADSLLNGGSRVRMTLQGPATGSLTLLTVTISHADAGAEDFDSEAQPTVVAQNVVIAAGVDETIPPVGSVAFNLDNTRPLLIAFDVSDQAGQFRVSFGQLPVPDAETKAFISTNVAEARTQDRTGFNAVDGAFYLIKQIEVL